MLLTTTTRLSVSDVSATTRRNSPNTRSSRSLISRPDIRTVLITADLHVRDRQFSLASEDLLYKPPAKGILSRHVEPARKAVEFSIELGLVEPEPLHQIREKHFISPALFDNIRGDAPAFRSTCHDLSVSKGKWNPTLVPAAISRRPPIQKARRAAAEKELGRSSHRHSQPKLVSGRPQGRIP